MPNGAPKWPSAWVWAERRNPSQTLQSKGATVKIVSFRTADGTSFGVLSDRGVVDAGRRLQLPDLRAALTAGALGKVATLVAEQPDHALVDLQLLPPVPNPDKVFCVGLNYATHLKETGRENPPYPMLFPRYPESQVGHLQPMLRPPESEMFDFEGELAVVIGRRGRRVDPAKALDHVAGYACYNDGTLRDWQRHTSQFLPGKNFAGSGSFGPWLVTADEIPDPSRLILETRLNGQVMQHAPVSDLIFDVSALIAYISTFLTLEPGDVISTGTTGGVGAFRKPPVWMRAGDTIEIEISGIGVLSNPIVDEA
jgi:2-keto-4-pentenoate hydratase/2-oxohepta-3-ene-1,7-dioic acid hydratase in catechol pathway